jgi:hypothetical protein
MALKLSYTIDGRTWMPLSRAATLLATNVVGVKRLMGSGDIDWRQLRAGSTTLLVDEAAVLALRLSRGIPAKQRARENAAATRTAQARGRSMLATPPEAARRSSGAFVRTWDPAPANLPVSGRSTPDDPSKP